MCCNVNHLHAYVNAPEHAEVNQQEVVGYLTDALPRAIPGVRSGWRILGNDFADAQRFQLFISPLLRCSIHAVISSFRVIEVFTELHTTSCCLPVKACTHSQTAPFCPVAGACVYLCPKRYSPARGTHLSWLYHHRCLQPADSGMANSECSR